MKYFLLETDKKISQLPQIVQLHDKIDVRDRAQTAVDGKGRYGYLLSGCNFNPCFSAVAGSKKGCGDV